MSKFMSFSVVVAVGVALYLPVAFACTGPVGAVCGLVGVVAGASVTFILPKN